MSPLSRSCMLLLIVLPLARANAQDQAVETKAAIPATADPAINSEIGLSERIERLIEQLGHREYALRERAQEELDEIGPPAFDALMEAHRHRDLEISHRTKFLIDKIRRESIETTVSPEIRKLLANYESLSDQERLVKLRQLSRMPHDHALATLCRLIRFERSNQLAKQGAILLLDHSQSASKLSDARRKAILDQVALSDRPAARWLRAYANSPKSPAESLAQWSAFIADEDEVLKRSATPEQRYVVAGLLRKQVVMLLASKQTEPALAALRRLLDLQQTDSEGLPALVEWIIANQAWTLLDEVGKRLENQASSNSELLYALARAYQLKGDSQQADALSQRALDVNHASPVARHDLAIHLRKRGMPSWAERELRKLIESAPDPRIPYLQQVGKESLASLLADGERYREAADTLDEVVAWLDKTPGIRNELLREPKQIRATAHHYRAKQFAAESDTARQVEQLKKALQHDPHEADVLIALYRLPDQSDAAKAETRAKIKKVADQFRQQIAASPDDPEPMNQFAWLIANTEGDFDEAAQWSHRSVELLPPDSAALAGLLDTLAHCYAAKKDYEKALEHQSRAIELEPHSGEIRRAYERFKQASEEAKAPQEK